MGHDRSRNSWRCAQVRNCCPTASNDTEEVELDHPDPQLVPLFDCRVICAAAGHLDQYVDSTEFGGYTAKARSTEDTSVTAMPMSKTVAACWAAV
jgi:hypothetical protein